MNGGRERSFQANHPERFGELRGKGKLAAAEGRVRKSGGGRKPIEEGDPAFARVLEQVMDERTVGDPMSPLKWDSKSTYQIRQYMASQGHSVSEDTLQRRLRDLDYSLQANRKDKEGNLTPTGTGSSATPMRLPSGS